MSTSFREPATETPPAPRAISAEIERDATQHGKVLRIFGAVWALVGLALAAGLSIGALASGAAALAVQGPIWGLVGVAGAFVWLLGWLRKRAALEVFRNGVEVPATVVEVKQNHHIRVNGRNPWDVTYAYASPTGEQVRGLARSWGERPDVEVGEGVTALHHPDAPSRSVLWTRLEPGARRRVRIDDTEERVAALEARLAAAEARVRVAEGEADEPSIRDAEAEAQASVAADRRR